MPVEPLPCIAEGTSPGPGPVPGESCCAPSITTAEACLEDGTPIVLVLRSACACDGDPATAPEVAGWLDPATGTWSGGRPPAGTVACGGSRRITTNGLFCDVLDDGTVAGLVLIEYQYAADGSIDTVRLVDAVTGETYTPQGELTTCPSSGEQAERSLVQLCDQSDGETVPFVRDYARDETGAIVDYQDYTLDGVPYEATGEVSDCSTATAGPVAEPCTLCETLTLWDLWPDESPGESPGDESGFLGHAPAAIPFLREVCRDCDGQIVSTADTTLDGVPYTPGGDVTACAPSQPACQQHLLEECRWDDTDSDGIGDTEYVELIAVDGCTGALSTLGTYTTDLTEPYDPVAPGSPAPVEGVEPTRAMRAHRVELAPGEAWTATSVTGLQSVTSTAHDGTGTITTEDGTTTLHMNESVKWSVVRDVEAVLTGPLTVVAVAGAVTVTYTSAVTV